MNTFPAFLLPQRNPAFRFVREAITPRTALVGAAFLAIVSLGLAAVNVGTAALSCGPGESVLVYPLYSRKGIVIDSIKRCGASHRGCTPRMGSAGVYDCSPFMAPEGVMGR